jgi:hypothetical protein
MVHNRILPEVAELRKAAAFAPSRIAKRMATASALVSLKTLFPQLVADWVIGGGALAFVAAIQRERDRAAKARLESAFSFLIQVQDNAGRQAS